MAEQHVSRKDVQKSRCDREIPARQLEEKLKTKKKDRERERRRGSYAFKFYQFP